jgi:hypothetical protein
MDEYQLEFATGFGESYLNCPACGKEMIPNHDECFSCGVVVKRYKERVELQKSHEEIGGISHLTAPEIKALDRKWKQVVVNYFDQSEHMGFIRLCQKQGALPFAIHQYSQILKVNKEDDIAQLMQRRAMSCLSVHFETVDKVDIPQVIGRGLQLAVKWVNWLGLFFSSFCIVAGLSQPDAKNLIGLGVTFLTLFIAMYIYRKY